MHKELNEFYEEHVRLKMNEKTWLTTEMQTLRD